MAFLILRNLELFTRKACEMFVYKHTETIECAEKQPFLRKIQTLRVNNSRIPRTANAKLSEYHFYLKTNI